jgi:hypothetical protein
MTRPPPSGYHGPTDPARDRRLCDRCGDPIRRLAEHVTPAWLSSREAVDPEALALMHDYALQLATLWWWTFEAIQGAARGNGQAELRTYQRGGDPTFERLSAGEADPETGNWLRTPDIADRAAVILRGRSRREAKRIRDATTRLRKELDAFAAADDANLEAERAQWEQQAVT